MATISRRVAKRASSSEGARRRSKANDDPLTDAELLKLVPSGLESAFVKSKLHDKRLAIAGLGAPPDWDGDMPELSRDVAALDHDQMANLLADLVNALSTALWQASKAHIDADVYEEMADYLEDKALLNANESNEGKRKAQARTDERVLTMRSRQKMANRDYMRFRDLARTIEFKWRTVSRVGGFLGDEADGEVASAIKHSTRGTARGSAPGTAKGESRRRPRK